MTQVVGDGCRWATDSLRCRLRRYLEQAARPRGEANGSSARTFECSRDRIWTLRRNGVVKGIEVGLRRRFMKRSLFVALLVFVGIRWCRASRRPRSAKQGTLVDSQSCRGARPCIMDTREPFPSPRYLRWFFGERTLPRSRGAAPGTLSCSPVESCPGRSSRTLFVSPFCRFAVLPRFFAEPS